MFVFVQLASTLTDMEWKYRKHEIDTETRDRNIIYTMDDLQQLRSRKNKLSRIQHEPNVVYKS